MAGTAVTQSSDLAAVVSLPVGGRVKRLTKGQQLAADLRKEMLKEPGLGECLQLCEASEIDRVCDLVAEDFKVFRLGYPEDARMAKALRQLLIEPIRRYEALLTVKKRVMKLPNGEKVTLASGVRMEAASTAGLLSMAGKVADALEAKLSDERSAHEMTEALRHDWFVWLGYVASYWLQYKVPVHLTQTRVRQEQGRLGGKAPKDGATRSTAKAAQIIAAYVELSRRLEPKNVAGAVALKLGCTPQWVRRVWSRHEAAGALAETKAKRQAGV